MSSLPNTTLQFNTYDPDKIHSQPGVRSDLFQRRLSDALVTDFFGGVSQAEVLPPLFPAAPQVSFGADDSAVEEDISEVENTTDVTRGTGGINADVFFAALEKGQASEVGLPITRKLRTWASSVGVIVLVGWVLARRK